jgi:hypothetical protein
MRVVRLNAHYYQQFDADLSRPVPAEGYGGWKETMIEVSVERTAVVVMHAWDTGTPERHPGWYRAVEYLPRANEIGRTVLPVLLSAVRRAGMPLFHVVGGGDYYKGYAGYQRAVRLAGPSPAPPAQAEADPVFQRLKSFREENVFTGPRNQEDVSQGLKSLDFMPSARPLGDEGVAEDDRQLFALCADAGVNHLIYAGFAINWCLLMSPGGMVDMNRRGFVCSTVRQAVTAVENRETARKELNKELGLWRVALAFGFVFDLEDLLSALGPR